MHIVVSEVVGEGGSCEQVIEVREIIIRLICVSNSGTEAVVVGNRCTPKKSQ